MARLPDASATTTPRPLVIACGALARELAEILGRPGTPPIDLTILPATLHQRPDRIPAAVTERIRERRTAGQPVFVAYADCGTGGALDRALEALAEEEPGLADGIERIPGAHCYEFYAGSSVFAALADEEPGTYYLTDFLAKAFDRLVWDGLGLDRHPELLPLYFGNYRRVVYLAQSDDPEILEQARAAAERLGLAFEVRHTGLEGLAAALPLGRQLPVAAAPVAATPVLG